MKLPPFVLDLNTPSFFADSIALASHKKKITKTCTRRVSYTTADGKHGTATQSVSYKVSGMHLKGKSNDEENYCAQLNNLTATQMGVPAGAAVQHDACSCGVSKSS